jgi:hypothetical protein
VRGAILQAGALYGSGAGCVNETKSGVKNAYLAELLGILLLLRRKKSSCSALLGLDVHGTRLRALLKIQISSQYCVAHKKLLLTYHTYAAS